MRQGNSSIGRGRRSGRPACVPSSILFFIASILLPLLVTGCAEWFRPPAFQISIVREGSSVQEVEKLLIKPMEDELGGIQNLRELRSFASPDHATITALFEPGSAPQPAAANVVKAVQRAKAKLPGDTQEPEVTDVTHGYAN